jgi:hypothetical protein
MTAAATTTAKAMGARNEAMTMAGTRNLPS